MLLGSASGALIGSTIAIDKAKDRLSVLEQMMDAMPNGSTMLIATVGEYAQEVINGMVQKLDGSVMRRPWLWCRQRWMPRTKPRPQRPWEARCVLRGKQTEEWREKLDDLRKGRPGRRPRKAQGPHSMLSVRIRNPAPRISNRAQQL